MKILPFKSVTFLLLVSNIFVSGLSLLGETITSDIVIYGGTSAAISAAVQVKKMGKSVVVVSPDKRIGGMTTNGLGWTDIGNKEAIGGIAREFYHRVWRYYQTPDVWRWQKFEEFGNRGQGAPAIDGDRRTMWIFEPKAAMEIFESWIIENEIEVYRDEWLDRSTGVELLDRTIIAITCLSGKRFEGKIFMDCTYEGDLMAAAGVNYVTGREGNDIYNETLNGVQTALAQKNQFVNRIDPFIKFGEPQSGLLPRISDWVPAKDGIGDKKIQAYNFRLCLTREGENREPFPKPEIYDPLQYEVLLRTLSRGSRHIFVHFNQIPNAKTDTNNHGSFSTDNIGMNYEYPDGTYSRRKEIIKEHENYLKGYFYFLCNDPRVPEDVRYGMTQWGLARDEFIENSNWPEQLYIREARRMVGKAVMTEHEVTGRKKTDKSIGMGSYTMDSHNVQRYVAIDESGKPHVLNEGDFQIDIKKPYQISYEAILPKRIECENLIVPVCLSASHVAFSSIRMEPVFMILGQSAATAAALAVGKEISLHSLTYSDLREQLLKDGQVLEVKNLKRLSMGEGIPLETLGGVVVDGSTVELEGDWIESTSLRPFVGDSYFHDGNGAKGLRSAKFPFVAPMNGLHEIKVAFSSFGNRAGDLRYNVKHKAGESYIFVDQRKSKSDQMNDLWYSLGSFEFEEGEQYYVSLSNENTDGYVIVDAIQVLGLRSGLLSEGPQ